MAAVVGLGVVGAFEGRGVEKEVGACVGLSVSRSGGGPAARVMFRVMPEAR